MASNHNTRSPSVKRILQEMKEMKQLSSNAADSGTCQFAAEALESDIFEWHFAVRGPDDSEFASGIYHGRILLPHDYPFNPPSFVMLTPSGRFETNTKICLSISSYHPEHWQPSWSMRTALTALVAFFPTPGDGAVGSMSSSAENRRNLAAESRVKIPAVASAERRAVMERLHAALLHTFPVPATSPCTTPSTHTLESQTQGAVPVGSNAGPAQRPAAMQDQQPPVQQQPQAPDSSSSLCAVPGTTTPQPSADVCSSLPLLPKPPLNCSEATRRQVTHPTTQSHGLAVQSTQPVPVADAAVVGRESGADASEGDDGLRCGATVDTLASISAASIDPQHARVDASGRVQKDPGNGALGEMNGRGDRSPALRVVPQEGVGGMRAVGEEESRSSLQARLRFWCKVCVFLEWGLVAFGVIVLVFPIL